MMMKWCWRGKEWWEMHFFFFISRYAEKASGVVWEYNFWFRRIKVWRLKVSLPVRINSIDHYSVCFGSTFKLFLRCNIHDRSSFLIKNYFCFSFGVFFNQRFASVPCFKFYILNGLINGLKQLESISVLVEIILFSINC